MDVPVNLCHINRCCHISSTAHKFKPDPSTMRRVECSMTTRSWKSHDRFIIKNAGPIRWFLLRQRPPTDEEQPDDSLCLGLRSGVKCGQLQFDIADVLSFDRFCICYLSFDICYFVLLLLTNCPSVCF